MPSEFPDFVWEAIKAEQLWTGGEPCVLSAAVLEELYTGNVDAARTYLAQVDSIHA